MTVRPRMPVDGARGRAVPGDLRGAIHRLV